MKGKRQRVSTHPIESANLKTDDQFVADYLQYGTASKPSPWVSEWAHPTTGANYAISLVGAPNISDADLEACFNLIAETSQEDYEGSAGRWRPASKLKEMKSAELRYILVRATKAPTSSPGHHNESDQGGEIRGFTSLMPTFEAGEPVVYCYEIHLKPDLQGTGLGSLLMSFHTTVAENLPPITKVMLTCFVANERGLRFYKKLGFEKDALSPEGMKLRGRMFVPDYMIMSKRVRDDECSDDPGDAEEAAS